jgi:hypothetical protein
MIRNGMNTSPNNKDMLVGCFTLILLFVGAVTLGVWLQKETLGIYRLEERVERLESKLSE